MRKEPERRSLLYVSRELQGSALFGLARFWGAYHVALYCVMFLQRYLRYRADLLAGRTTMSLGELHTEFIVQNSSVVLCALIVFPLVAWDVLKVTHRIAGPLYRFRRTLESLTRREPVANVRLRQGDLCVNLETAFNDYLATLDGNAEDVADDAALERAVETIGERRPELAAEPV